MLSGQVPERFARSSSHDVGAIPFELIVMAQDALHGDLELGELILGKVAEFG